MSLTTSYSTDLELPEDGTIPEKRIEDADKAIVLVDRVLQANELRAKMDSRVKGMLDGNPPFSISKLHKAGQSYRCNVNFREAEGIHDAAMSPYYDLFAEAPTYAEVSLNVGTNDRQGRGERIKKSKVVTEEFDRMLREYSGFDYNMQLAMSDMVAYGKGFVFWDDSETWHFKNVRQSRILVPDGTKADPDQLEILVVLQSLMVHDLYKMVKDESASEVGWNREAAIRAIENASTDHKNQSTAIDIEQIQQRIRNNDLYESIRSDTVQVAHIYVKEFDGTITHLIVPRQDNRRNQQSEVKEKAEYLFEKEKEYENFRQVFGSLFYGIGDGEWHSVKGLLVKMYPFIEIKNRLRCSTIDNTFLNNSVLVQPTTERAFQDFALQQAGPLTILRNGLEIRQFGLAGRIEEGLAVERSLDNQLASNIGQYRPQPRREQGNPETATEIRADIMKETALNNTSVNMMYAQLDFVYSEIYRRCINPDLVEDSSEANKSAIAFRKRCRERGVNESDLKKVRFVRAYRNVGNGSPFLRQQAIRETGALVSMFNEEGRQNWLNDAIGVTTNQEMVERYNPPNDQFTQNNDHVTAALQAAAMKDGVMPRVTGDQNHAIFATVYLEEAANALSSLEQGANPQEVLMFLEIIGPQIATRIGLAGQDKTRKNTVAALEAQFKKIAAATDRVRQAVQAQARQAQANAQRRQRMSEEGQIKAEQMQREEARRDVETENDMRRKTAKTKLDMQIKEAKAAQKLSG